MRAIDKSRQWHSIFRSRRVLISNHRDSMPPRPPVSKPWVSMLEMYHLLFPVLEKLHLTHVRSSTRISHSAGHRLLLAFASASSLSSTADEL